MNPELPVVLSSLFDNSLADADYPTLLKKSEEAFELLQVTKKQQELVEEKTCEQASSRLWFRMWTGRITASKFKNACHTDPACPSHTKHVQAYLPNKEDDPELHDVVNFYLKHTHSKTCRKYKNINVDLTLASSSQIEQL